MLNTLERPVDLPGSELDVRNIERAALLIAHPDDDSIFNGLVRKMLANNVEVDVIVATNGELSDRGDPNELQDGIRIDESDAAFDELEIPEENRHYEGLPDADMLTWPQIRSLAATTFDILDRRKIDLLLTLGHEGFDGHFDHIGTHIAGLLAAERSRLTNPNIRVLGAVSTGGDFYTEADPESTLRSLAHHATQFGIDTSDPTYQPEPGTIEVPGIHVPPRSRQLLEPYRANMQFERLKQYM